MKINFKYKRVRLVGDNKKVDSVSMYEHIVFNL